LSRHVENTLLRIHHCRTEALGRRVYRCDPCDYEMTVFNSCGDRHCPNCSGAKRMNWLDKTLGVICRGVTYFQVVFTLPQELSALALGNRTAIYNLLFETAWQSLQTKVEKEVGIQAAGLAVLHTWDQRLNHHPHIHLMVPGNGPSLDGTRWIECGLTKGTADKPPAPFLVDNKELGRDFRDLFLARLEKEVERGKIRLEDAGYISDLIGDLKDHAWVVFIEGPPRPDCPPDRMLKYLTRYLTGGPISDQRIVGERDGRIHFMARSKRKIEGKRPQVEEKLPVVEFTRRWTLHILQPEFTKVRWYGNWSPRHRIEYTERCQRLYTAGFSSEDPGGGAPSTTEGDKPCTTSPRKEESRSTKERPCPHCAQPMACIVDEHRPSWREVFYGPYHPEWFEWVTTGNFPPDEPPDKVDGESLNLADAASALAENWDLFEELDSLLEQALE
jgi:hypothetical protein